jgi:hypothetical protein
MKNKFIILLFGLLFVWNLWGQTLTDYDNQINSIFQNIDKSRVSTGLLYDYGVHLIDPIYYNGTLLSDSNYVDIDIWNSLYWTMYSTKVNNNISLQTPDQISSIIDTEGATSLAVMHLKYTKFMDNAITSGLLTVSNDKLYDVSGKNPYEEKMIFAIAPKNAYFASNTATFKFNSNLNINNTGKTVKSLQINFNNENGYRTVTWNTEISHSFSTEGIKDVYFRIIYTDNSTYTVRTKISVTKEPSPELRSDANISINATSNHSGGNIQIKYSPNNNTGRLRKPLIVAEGFDPGEVIESKNKQDISSFIKAADYGTVNAGNPNILNRLNILDYDIVYLDYSDGLDDIRRNARLFQEVIEYVNTNKTGGQPNVVLGISMGGLVARYALRKMETENKEHDTWKYISVDSPHKGANIPIGVQALLRHVENTEVAVLFVPVWKAKNLNQVKKGLALLNSKAAKQMLTYYVVSNLTVNNTEHNNFQTEYDNLGFPTRCQNIAIADGSGNGNMEFAAGTNLINANETFKLKGWMDLITTLFGGAFIVTNYPKLILLSVPGKSSIEATIRVNAVPNKTTAQVYYGRVRLNKKILWLISSSATIIEKSVNSSSSLYPIDSAPGGVYDLIRMLPSADRVSLPVQFFNITKFTFIPTVSALALSNWQSLLTSSLRNQTLYPNYTTFERYYMPTANDLHTNFDPAASFMITEISATPQAAQILGTVNISSNKQYGRDIIVRNGGHLNITGNALLNAANKTITVQNGGKITLSNTAKIDCNIIDVNLGGIIQSNSGTTITVK